MNPSQPIVTAVEVRVIRCMCGAVPCRHCGRALTACAGRRFHGQCPSCGCPRALPLNQHPAQKP